MPWTVEQAAARWGLAEQEVVEMCEYGKIVNAVNMFDKVWIIPEDVVVPYIGNLFDREHIEITDYQNYEKMPYFDRRNFKYVFESLAGLVSFLGRFNTTGCHFRG